MKHFAETWTGEVESIELALVRFQENLEKI